MTQQQRVFKRQLEAVIESLKRDPLHDVATYAAFLNLSEDQFLEVIDVVLTEDKSAPLYRTKLHNYFRDAVNNSN